MDLIQLTEGAYQLRAGSNAGLVVQEGDAILVDTGLDKDSAKKILRHLDSLHLRLTAVLVTHAHADHFGGAATIRARTGAPVYAPSIEAAVIENPLLEPLCLYSGAMPPAELRHKFTLADACPVDHLLELGEIEIGGIELRIIPAPGHAPNQVIVGGGGACFVADAVFAPDVLEKHAVPFLVDIDQWQATLAALPGLDGRYTSFVPGHGPAAPEIRSWAHTNSRRLSELRTAVDTALQTSQTGDLAEIVKITADALGLLIPNPVIYWLTQTPVLACLVSLQRAGAAVVGVAENRLAWLPKSTVS